MQTKSIFSLGRWCHLVLIGLLSWSIDVRADNETITLYGAGSLRAALSDVAEEFQRETGTRVETRFSPSGLLRERIAEEGGGADVFASANMAHPRALAADGIGGPVVLFARNQLCALAQSDLAVDSDTVLDVLLDGSVRLGTSTPKADPSGDYAWEVFRRAEKVRNGSFNALSKKALTLTGGPDSRPAPKGRNLYAWVLTENRADIFLTYCTNAVLARQDTPELKIIRLPDNLAVGADYGLSLLSPDHPVAARFALFILSPGAQATLAAYGFDAPGVVDD